jgi:hypothetical protein
MQLHHGIAAGVMIVTLMMSSAEGRQKFSYDDKLSEAAQTILSEAEQFDLFSLGDQEILGKDPRGGFLLGSTTNEKYFHGYAVLGKVSLKEASIRARLISALSRGIDENKGLYAACFDPHHGIRAVRKGRILDLVICFECLKIKVYLTGSPMRLLRTTASPQEIFDTVFTGSIH